MKQTVRAVGVLLLFGVVSSQPVAWAQVPPGSAPNTSVLATGGGQGLLDTSRHRAACCSTTRPGCSRR